MTHGLTPKERREPTFTLSRSSIISRWRPWEKKTAHHMYPPVLSSYAWSGGCYGAPGTPTTCQVSGVSCRSLPSTLVLLLAMHKYIYFLRSMRTRVAVPVPSRRIPDRGEMKHPKIQNLRASPPWSKKIKLPIPPTREPVASAVRSRANHDALREGDGPG